MNEPDTKSDFLLLFRGTNWDKGLSPEQIQAAMGKLMGWFDELHQRGIIKAGQPLGEEGRSVSGRKGQLVADGPFAESKEAVGGYLILSAGDLNDATLIAQSCPCLEYGGIIEVRPIAEECPTFQRVRKQLSMATA